MKSLNLKNGDTVIIRKAVKSDARSILDYIDVISEETDFLTFGKGEFDISLEEEENFIADVSTKSNAVFLVATLGNRVIGNLTYSGGGRPRIEHSGEFGVGVVKEYWDRGIGSELVKYLIEFCKESRLIRKINLRVRSDNDSAIHLYKRLGFIEEGCVTRDFLIKGVFYDSILMGLEID